MVHGHFRGMHTGPLATAMGDVPATGRVLDCDDASRLRVMDGRIIESRIFFA